MTKRTSVAVREATPADASHIARIQIDTWHTAYKGLMPDEVLANQDYEARTERYLTILGDPHRPTFHYVAEDDGGSVVGFASGGPTREEEYAAEFPGQLYAIYVLQEHQGKGMGRALLLAVADRIARNGYNSMLLWVLAENWPSRRFYESMGGEVVGEGAFEIGGASLPEVAYGWRDLGALLSGSTSK